MNGRLSTNHSARLPGCENKPMAALEQRISRHDREIAKIRRLLRMSATEHVKHRKEMREIRESHKLIQAEHGIVMREIRELKNAIAGALERRGNGHHKRRLQ